MSGKVLDIFRSDRTSDLRFRAEELAPVMCYDPWFSRALETIRQSIKGWEPGPYSSTHRRDVSHQLEHTV